VRGAEDRAHDYDSLAYVGGQLELFRDERDWGQFHTPKNLALSVSIEAAELLEHFQWIGDDEVAGYVAEHREDIAEELADVLIYVIQLAQVLGISPSGALASKLALNAERYPVRASRGSSAKHTAIEARRAS
jgi:NTP pyrophosphatase (non-canonical NTP hydrolase)